MKYDIQRVQRRASAAFSNKQQKVQHLHEDAVELIAPIRRTNKYDHGHKQDLHSKLYDSTAVDGASALASTMVMNTVPVSQQWMTLVPGPRTPEGDREQLQKALKQASTVLISEFTKAHFQNNVRPAYLDLLFGTGCIRIEPEGKGGLRFTSIPLEALAVDVDRKGVASYVYHTQEMRRDELFQEFGNAEGSQLQMNKSFMDRLDKAPDECIEYITAAEPVHGTDDTMLTVYLTDGDHQTLLQQKQLEYNPYTVARWELVTGSPYGSGPCLNIFGDVRYLNKASEVGLKSAIMAMNPPHLVRDNDIVNVESLVLSPGTMIAVDSNERENPPIVPYTFAGDIRLAEFLIDRRRGDIDRRLLANHLGNPTGTPMTAEEVIQRSQMINKALGMPGSMIASEWLEPLIRKAIVILAPIYPDLFNVLKEMNKNDTTKLDVVFENTLTRAAKLAESQNVIEFAQIATTFAQVDPAARHVVDVAEAVSFVGNNMQVPAEVLRSVSEAKQAAQQEQQQQLQMLQAQQQMQQGGAAPPGG